MAYNYIGNIHVLLYYTVSAQQVIKHSMVQTKYVSPYDDADSFSDCAFISMAYAATTGMTLSSAGLFPPVTMIVNNSRRKQLTANLLLLHTALAKSFYFANINCFCYFVYVQSPMKSLLLTVSLQHVLLQSG